MTRRASARTSGIQMFPFLAVLICTMGALVVLLHAFARHGQMQARKLARAKTEAEHVNVDDLQWRIGHLRTARAKTEAQLADERLKLAHVEDHARRLQAQLQKLKIAADELERATAEKSDAARHDAAALEAAKADVDAARKALDDALGQGKNPSVNYSVVPYRGRNGTSRRPIYIECRENLIILQPEGIELTPKDFVGYFGPGNPLAAGVRAESEYFARQAPGGKLDEEPYPLLLVRPEGTAAYYVARAALDSWGSEFGYELVGSDWTLKFPPPDPELARLLKQVVGEARLRHREYILTSPQVARSRPRPVYRAKAHGGFAPERGSAGLGSGGRGRWDEFAGDWARGPGGTAPEDRYGSQDDRYADSDERFSWGSQSASGGAELRDPYADEPGDGSGDSAQGTDGGTSKGSHNADATGTARDAAGLDHDGTLNSNGSKHTPGGTPSQSPSTSGVGQTNSGSTSSGSPSSGSSSSGSPSSAHASAQGAHQTRCMATTRGKNWGLPESSASAVAATRPILVECYADRLVVASETRGQPPKEIRLSAKTEDSMDEFVSAVWDHMKGWGKAGRGLYWRPTLSMAVKPGAADRYADIKALLADSGLDVHERQPPAPPRQATRPPQSNPW